VQCDESTIIRERIASVLSAIEDSARISGRNASEIELIAVSKKQVESRVLAAYEAGLRNFAENYAQGLQAHSRLLPDDVRWHFIGHIQSKKAKQVARASFVHSIESQKVAAKLSAAAQESTRLLPVLLNVNISRQESKTGVMPDGVLPLLETLETLSGLEVRGLMCIPSPSENPRAAFARLRELRDTLEGQIGRKLPTLSMGMSRDFREAIAEGSTMVRVGTGIFGARIDAAAH